MWKQPRDRRGLVLDYTESRWLSWDLTLGPRKTSPHSFHLSSLSIKGMRELAQGGECWWSRREPQSAKALLRNDTLCLQITGHSFPENAIVLQIPTRVPGTARRSNQSILKEINPEYSLEGLMLKLQYFGHLMQSRLIGKDPDATEEGGRG